MTSLRSLLKNETPHSNPPHLDRVSPPAAMPGGEVQLHGAHLGPSNRSPYATIGDTSAPITLSRPTRATVQIPEGAISGDIVIHNNGHASNALNLRVAVPMAQNLHPVANPAVDAEGNVFATLSGARGQATPVSIFKIQRDFQITPFVRELLNATGLAFDRVGNLFVGDRSGTIFKIGRDREIFVFATLEPSIAAYHLAFNDAGTLFVTGPTTSSNQAVHAIDRDGNSTVFYQGLGRAQGMA